jgi:hypothetical protein
MKVSTTFDFDAREYYRALRFMGRYNAATRWVPVFAVGLPLVMFFLIVIRAWGRISARSAFLNMLPWILLGGFYLALVPLMQRTWARKATEYDPSLRGQQTRIVDESGLEVRGEDSHQHLTWPDIRRVAEGPEFFLFFYNKRVAHYLPKRTLNAVEIGEVRELAEANAPGRLVTQAGSQRSA